MNWKAPKKILIKTYAHESGLWYLSLSLYNELTKQGHDVKFVPKSKFVRVGNRFNRAYIPGIPEYKDLFYTFDPKVDIGSQVSKAIYSHRANALISMETIMESPAWIKNVKKRTGVEIIDVPMLEWVNPIRVKSGAYNVFDEIWATTDMTYDTLKAEGVRGVKIISWDFVDRDLFFLDQNPFRSNVFSFYHQGSLNPSHSSKNTGLVLKAFDKLNEEFADISLVITGVVDSPELNKIIEKHTNIKIYNRVLSRQEVASLYNNTDCVVAPSSKEGLGLSLFEAEACGCELITTDAPPMNSHNTKYLCKTYDLKTDGTYVPVAKLNTTSVYEQMKKVYEEKHVR
jgi:glycosyltransferase involved in cell wall biosynthesis